MNIPSNKQTDQRGALMIEAIALLGLMTMMSPMVVRQTSERTAEVEEIAVAGQMKEIKEALNNWIEANYARVTKNDSHYGSINPASTTDAKFSVSAQDLAEYMPSSYIDASGNFLGNKLVDSFKIGVRAQCTEVRKDDGSECAAGTCYTLTNGTVSSIPPNSKCSRYKMTGVVLSDNSGLGDGMSKEIDDRRIARIAQMIGADGGYMRTSAMNSNVYSTETDANKKIVGAQGIWEGNLDNYFTTSGDSASVDPSVGGRIAATTIYSSGFSGDYLYRKKVDGLPGANSMFTDLDMGGATECNDTGCHKIANAGGMEVVGGKIVIRKKNNGTSADALAEGTDGTDSYAWVSLGTENSRIKTTNAITLQANNHVRIEAGTGNKSLIELNRASNTVDVRGMGGIKLYAGSSGNLNLTGNEYNLNSTSANLQINNHMEAQFRNAAFRSTSTNLIMNEGDIAVTAGDGAKLLLANNSTALLHGGYQLDLSSDMRTFMRSNEIHMNANFSISAISNGFSVNARNGTINMTSNNRIQMNVQKTNLHLAPSGINSTFNNSTFSLSEEGGLSLNLALNAAVLNFTKNKGLYIYSSNTTNTSLYDNKTYDAAHTLMFATSQSGDHVKSGLLAFSDSKRGNGLAVLPTLNNGLNSSSVPNINLYGDSGRISAAFFQPEQMNYGNGSSGPVVLQSAHMSVDGETGLTNGSVNNSSHTAFVTKTLGSNGSAYVPYNEHTEDSNYYNKFRVDPAFTSVMNDIIITSRGGARLSEAMPNYLLKGIYEMSNSYGFGGKGWPCDGSYGTCNYNMPYYSKTDLGLSSGGYEFNCDGNSTTHPAVKGSGTCTEHTTTSEGVTKGYVSFGQSTSLVYPECPANTYCWAHPYMGVVPAPGRTAKVDGDTTMYAQDEGNCPDGYQAVMTITPNVIEMGRLLYINSEMRPSDSKVSYNAGWQNYTNENIRNVTGLFQLGTRLGIKVEPIVSSSRLSGWKIAMGTVTPTADSFIWNMGGVPAYSMTALAHTYCYFNPDRFTMPNMKIDSNNMIKPMDNPILGGSKSGWMQ